MFKVEQIPQQPNDLAIRFEMDNLGFVMNSTSLNIYLTDEEADRLAHYIQSELQDKELANKILDK